MAAGATSFTYNNADQLLTQTKSGVTRSFGYDAAGNQTSSPVSPTTNSSWTYDARNQPLTATVPGQPAVTYTYDALGRRASRTANGSTETYAYVGDQVARIDRGSGNVTDSAIDAMGDRLTVGTAWTLPNVRGDVAGLLNAGQSAISDACRYDPFGVSLDVRGTTTNPYRFGGRLLESASGQYDFGARQYDPAIGAFTSLDSVIGSAQNPISLNRYLYGHANPEVMIDLDGHAATERDSYGQDRAAAKRAVDGARASLDAARASLTRAQVDYARAAAVVSIAAGRLGGTCPVGVCRKPADHKEWKQSLLDRWAFARAEAATAKTRVNIAMAAVQSAQRVLAAAQATYASIKPTSKIDLKPKDDGPGGLVHGALDVLGMIPIIGEPADLLNGGIYAAEGDVVNAGLSLASAIPLAGNVIGAGKLGLKYGDEVVGAVAHYGDDLVGAVAHYGDDLVGAVAHYGDDLVGAVAHYGDDLVGAGASKVDDVAGAVGSCVRHSFSPATAVATASGAVAIATLEVGDKVAAFNPDAGAVGEHSITAVHLNADPAVAYVRIDGEIVETTPDHPFLTDHGWVEAEDLEPGMQIRKLDGSYGTFEGWRIEYRPVEMWDLTVAEVHTFAVGEGEWVVHNSGPCGPIPVIDPAMVRFSQDTISSTFKNGHSLQDAVTSLRNGADPQAWAPIRLVDKGGTLFSLDNRRLAVFGAAGIGVPYRMATAAEAIDEAWKFTTRNGGTSIQLLIGLR